jgi:hypothetical protein
MAPAWRQSAPSAGSQGVEAYNPPMLPNDPVAIINPPAIWRVRTVAQDCSPAASNSNSPAERARVFPLTNATIPPAVIRVSEGSHPSRPPTPRFR